MTINALQDNLPLLKKMMADMDSRKDVYKPSPFWLECATETAKALKRYGLNNFRSTRKATPGLTWTDAPNLSVLDYTYSTGKTLKSKVAGLIFRTYLFKQKFLELLDARVRAGAESTYFKWYKSFRDYWVNSQSSQWFSEVLRNHSMPDTLVGGCIDEIKICDQVISPVYFATLARIFNFCDHTDFRTVKTMLIIGGGFGYEVHLIMSLFPNIKKCITLDIPPNLYVQTQYLKAVTQEKVRDYAETCGMSKINFSQLQEGEIIAIAPWQIEKVDTSIDLLWNSCSFQEMTRAQVKNYALFSQNLMVGTTEPRICLTMYESEARISRADIIDAFEGFTFKQIPADRRHCLPPPYEEFHYFGSKRLPPTL